MKLKYGAYSHQGNVRKTNQDYFYAPSEQTLLDRILMVADGMGGHNAGEVASKIAVETVLDYFTHNHKLILSDEDIKKSVLQAINNANSVIYQHSRANEIYLGMGTTLTIAYIHHDRAYIGHVGDSRAYHIKGTEVKQVTRDHSLVQELFDNGSITQKQKDIHPQRNIITRALGTDESVDIDRYELLLQDGDILLLCTDGLLYYVDLEQNIDIFKSGYSVNCIAGILGQKALDAGGADNITLVIAEYSSAEVKR